jgi:hypothetical protein
LTKYQKPHQDRTTDTEQYQQCRELDGLEARETARPAPIKVEFGDDDEAAAEAFQAYTSACDGGELW